MKQTSRFLGALVFAGVVLAGCGTASATTSSRVVHPTSADRTAMYHAFVAYKLRTGGMKSTDHVTWAVVMNTHSTTPLAAYDAVDHRYWALASFSLRLPASYAAEVSFQDGGSYGIFRSSDGTHWVMTGYPGVPICPSIVPAVVAHLWHLVSYGAC